MIWFGLAVVTYLYFVIHMIIKKDFFPELVFVAPIFLALFACFPNIAFAGLGIHPESSHFCNLQAITPSNSLSGSFFLGSGNVDGGPVYLYYCKKEVGYTAHTIDVRDAWIIEKVGPNEQFKEPVVRVNKSVRDSNFWSTFIIDDQKFKTEFYIPPGTVKQDYNVNG